MRYGILLFLCTALMYPFQALPHNRDRDCASSQVSIQPEDGSFYQGQVKDGVKHGHGRLLSADGSEYIGEFVDGEPHGSGIYHYPDGRSKKVLYKSGRLIEARLLSHETVEDGCVYGEFISLGRYTGWFKGNRIKGYMPHGRGVMRYFNGSVFSGQWSNGKMHGNGSVRWEDGSVYTGQWVRGKRTGYGTYTWANGESYVGEWKENEMCGKGIFYYNNGKVKKGTWKDITVTAGK